MKSMAKRTLPLTNGTLNFILPNSAENDFLTFVSKLSLRHVAEVFFLFKRRKPSLDLRQPIAVTRKGRCDKKHKATDLQQGANVCKIERHHECRGSNQDQGHWQ